jgi:hypothetical protein
MPKSGRTQDQLNDLIHRQFTIWAAGDGATTEFPIGKNVTRLDDLIVKVAGLTLRPADKGTAFDYAVRGVTPGYLGDNNTVKFTAAPVNLANICFIVNAD